MSKKPNFIEIDNFLIRTSLIQTVQLRKDYYGDNYISIVYRSPEGEKTFNSKSDVHNSGNYLQKYNELKEILN